MPVSQASALLRELAVRTVAPRVVCVELAAEFLYKSRRHGVHPVKLNVNDATQPALDWCERLYEAKGAGLVLYGRALGLSHAEAEDVLHETFIALLQRTAPPVNPEFYAVRAYRNRALNYRRSLWRRLAREFESVRWFERAEGESPRERAAMRCLTQLPPEQREVIVLKIWHGHTFEEIGTLLDLSPNTAAGRYRYGLQKLKVCLEGKSYERFESVGEPFAILEATPAVREG